MRALATIRVAGENFPIEGADKIVATRVDGWVCVTKKGEFNPGDKGVYFEIDSFLPATDSRYAFLEKNFITWTGQVGARLRTMKLRGQLSQGLFLPISIYPELANMEVGTDVTEILGIQKWEPPIPAQLAGEVTGKMRTAIPITDEERCVSGDTKLETEFGIKTIKEIVDIKFTGKVKSFNHEKNIMEFQNVIGWSALPKQKEKWLKIVTKSGKTILVTKNHKIWNDTSQSYLNAENLKIGDKVIKK